MNLRTRFYLRAMIGFILGMLISLIICRLSGTYIFSDSGWIYLTKQLIGSGLYGAAANGGAIVYYIESWGILKSTVVHYITTFSLLLLTANLLGWFENVTEIIVFFIILTIIYVIIWICESMQIKNTISEINSDLSRLKTY